MDETKGTQVNQLAGIFPSVRACAEFCGVSERHLRTQINRNQFPHVRIGRRIVLPKNAVIEWLNRTASQRVLQARATSQR
jgi:excisionase family DNA binding protein